MIINLLKLFFNDTPQYLMEKALIKVSNSNQYLLHFLHQIQRHLRVFYGCACSQYQNQILELPDVKHQLKPNFDQNRFSIYAVVH